MNRSRINLLIIATVSAFLGAGCSSPAFLDKQEVRDQRMRRHVAQFQKRERESRKNLDDLFATHERMVERHAEHRDDNRQLIESQIQKKQAERRKEMQEFIDVYRRENPDAWPDTWAKMFY
jgi:uncharacterized protein HemX